MPRFYFDTRVTDYIRDEQGIECDDFADVRREAAAGLADLAKSVLREAREQSFSVEVRDELDSQVMQLTMHVEVKITG